MFASIARNCHWLLDHKQQAIHSDNQMSMQNIYSECYRKHRSLFMQMEFLRNYICKRHIFICIQKRSTYLNTMFLYSLISEMMNKCKLVHVLQQWTSTQQIIRTRLQCSNVTITGSLWRMSNSAYIIYIIFIFEVRFYALILHSTLFQNFSC